MWIILEGVDGSGKSTFADAVAERLGRPKRTHLGPPKSSTSALTEVVDDEPFGSYTATGTFDIVSDRHHWGCPVYGPLMRPEVDDDGYGDFGRVGWRYSELYVASRGGTTFLIDVDEDVAIERIRRRGDENYSVETLVGMTPELVDRYRWLAAEAVTLGMHIRGMRLEETETYAHDVVDTAVARQYDAAPLAHWPDYVGVVTPTALIVCEPTREARLKILGSLGDEQWQGVGFCSSERSSDSLEGLVQALSYPRVLGLAPIPGEADRFVYNERGKVTHDVADLATII